MVVEAATETQGEIRAGGILERLRAATGAAHRALDEELDTVERLAVTSARVDMLQRYHALHATVEQVAFPHLAGLPGLDLAARRRSGMIAAGLQALDAAPRAPAVLPVLHCADAAAALGALYVVEGSTLGGRMILRALRGKAVDVTGLGFLDPYGPQTGQMWRGLVEVLQRHASGLAEGAAACDAATATFAFARCCFEAGVAA